MSDDVQKYFDRAADEFDAIYAGKGWLGRWIDRHFRYDIYERYRLTFETCGDVNGKTVLDVGCGSGRYAVEFALRGAAHVVGLDFAPHMLALARQQAIEHGVQDRCRFIAGDFVEVEFRQRFDICVAIGVLDYVGEPQLFLDKMKALATEWLIVSFPSKSLIRAPIRKFRYWLKRCPVYLYDRDDIQNLLGELNDYRIVKILGQGMDYFVSVRLSG